jgi:hypothetical protein
VFSLGPRGLSLSRSTFSALCRSNLASHSFWSPLVNANDSSLSVCQATMPRTGRAPRSIGRTQRRARCRCYGGSIANGVRRRDSSRQIQEALQLRKAF